MRAFATAGRTRTPWSRLFFRTGGSEEGRWLLPRTSRCSSPLAPYPEQVPIHRHARVLPGRLGSRRAGLGPRPLRRSRGSLHRGHRTRHRGAMRFFAARTQLGWGRMLAAREGPGASERGRALLVDARRAALAHGYAGIERPLPSWRIWLDPERMIDVSGGSSTSAESHTSPLTETKASEKGTAVEPYRFGADRRDPVPGTGRS